MVPQPSYYSMHQQQQYQPIYSLHHSGMQQFATIPQPLGYTVPGHIRSQDFHTYEEHIGHGSNGATEEDDYVENEGRKDKHPCPRNNSKNLEAIHDRANINQDGVAACGNRLQVHPRNHNAVSPHHAGVIDRAGNEPFSGLVR